MPQMLGDNDYFVPEKVERIWNLQPGTLSHFVGPHLRNNLIGTGGFGETFSIEGWLGDGVPSFPADDRAYGEATLEKRCCLKLIKKVASTEAPDVYEARTKLEYETLLDAAGANGRVPRPLALGKAYVNDSTYWAIVMEFLPNGNGTYFLSDSRIANDRFSCIPGLVEPLQAASFAYQLCRALLDLHARHITHRDLQPNNVAVRLSSARSIEGLPDRTGIVDRVYMIDLGNSTTIDRMVTPVMGGDHAPRAATFAYGAPEVFDLYEDGRVGDMWQYRNKPSADYWSMGGLIYYFVTGRHPSLVDPEQSSYRERAVLPKRKGLSLPSSKMDEFGDSEVMQVLDDIVRRCTVFDPLERAKGVSLEAFCEQLEALLTNTSGTDESDDSIPVDNHTPRLQRSVTAGPMSFDILSLYELEQSSERHQTYRRTVDAQRSYRLTCSYEQGTDSPDKIKGYANTIAQRIDQLFLHAGIAQFDALRRLGKAGAIVRPGKGPDPAYCTIAFTVPQSDGLAYVVELHLYFADDYAIMLSLSCLCPEELDYQTKLDIEKEMATIAATIKRV